MLNVRFFSLVTAVLFFVVEVRFMPTKAADIGNIIAAEPPGRGIEQMAYYSS